MAWLQAREEQVAVQQHSGQKIVEVVCNPTGQPANSFQFLGLTQALLEPVVRRIVHDDECVVLLNLVSGYAPPRPTQTATIGSWTL